MVASLYPRPLDGGRGAATSPASRTSPNRRTQKLSGGQTQRVRFAVALVSNPELLVLDEPTVAMDVEGRHAFWTTMRDFAARGRTVLFATHYLEEADANADRVVRDGPRARRRRRAADRDQGDGQHPHDPGDAAGRATVAELATLPGRQRCRPARRRDHARTAPTPMRPSARCSTAIPSASDIEITGAGLEEAFLQLTGVEDEDSAREIRDLHQVRAAAHPPQPALLLSRPAVPAGHVLPDRRPPAAQHGPRSAPASRRRSTTWSGWERSPR